MRFSILSILALTFALTGKVISFGDIPPQCVSVCSSLGQAEDRCDNALPDNSPEYNACVCRGTGAAQAIPLCEACYYQADRAANPNDDEQDWRDNDANRLLAPCSLTALATYNLATPSPTVVVAPALTTSGTSTFVPDFTAGPTTATTVTQTVVTTSPSSGIAAPTAAAGSLSFMAGAGLLAAAALL